AGVSCTPTSFTVTIDLFDPSHNKIGAATGVYHRSGPAPSGLPAETGTVAGSPGSSAGTSTASSSPSATGGAAGCPSLTQLLTFGATAAEAPVASAANVRINLPGKYPAGDTAHVVWFVAVYPDGKYHPAPAPATRENDSWTVTGLQFAGVFSGYDIWAYVMSP